MSTARLAYAADSVQRVYRVVVSHDGDVWVADVPELEGAHTQAGNLTRLDEAIREVIALVEDLPDGAEPGLSLTYEYEGLDDVAAAAAALGRYRAELDRLQALVADHTTALVHALADRDWSVRDIGPLLSISPGRVSQLRSVEMSPDFSLNLYIFNAAHEALPGLTIDFMPDISGESASGEMMVAQTKASGRALASSARSATSGRFVSKAQTSRGTTSKSIGNPATSKRASAGKKVRGGGGSGKSA